LTYRRILAYFAIPMADKLFPRDSWPWTVWRESAFMLTGESSYNPAYTLAELARLVRSDNLGPLGCWVLVELFSSVDRTQTFTEPLARLGLTKLDRGAFRADCEQLFCKVWPTVTRMARNLDQMSEFELNAIVRALQTERSTLERIRDALRGVSDEDAPDVLLATLEELWSDQWRQKVESRLRAIANSSVDESASLSPQP
jgi:hypothetical protein